MPYGNALEHPPECGSLGRPLHGGLRFAGGVHSAAAPFVRSGPCASLGGDSLTLVSRIVAGSSELGLLKNGLEQLDSTVGALYKERDSLLIVVQDQSRRADTLAGLVQRESVLRDLLRMDLVAAQQAEQLLQKRTDSLKIEVQFLTEKWNARPVRPAQPRPAGSVRSPR